MSLNRYECIGNLGRDVEVKTFQSGDRIATFSVATTERWKDRDGNRQERTEWSTWTVRGGLVEVAERYLKKGSKVFLAGSKRTREYDDRDGNKRVAVEFIATDLTMLDGKPDGERSGVQRSEQAGWGDKRGGGGAFGTADDDLADEIPFVTSDVRFERRAS